MVRLEVITKVEYALNDRFQFQYGTIRRQANLNYLIVGTIFQFQYGTIRRKIPKAFLCYWTNFNSSMVRLEVTKSQLSNLKKQISIPVWYD